MLLTSQTFICLLLLLLTAGNESDVAFNVISFIPNFMKINQWIQMLRYRQTHIETIIFSSYVFY